MSHLIDCYVYDVVRRLPEKDREEVKKELTSDLLDMLPEHYTENDVATVLQSLGSPSKMAEQYRSAPRYLISPANFDNYIMVLKLAAGVGAAIALIAGLMNNLFNLPQYTSLSVLVAKIIASLAVDVVSAVAAAFIWVTVIFASLDYVHAKRGEKTWTVGDLPEIPVERKNTIPHSQSISGIVFTVLFSVIFILIFAKYPDSFAWYEPGQTVIPLFNSGALTPFVPFMILLSSFTLLIMILKLIYGHWNLPIMVLTILSSVTNAVFLVVFISSPHLFNQAFLAQIAETTAKNLSEITDIWNQWIQVGVGLIILFTTLHILASIRRTRNKSSLLKKIKNFR